MKLFISIIIIGLLILSLAMNNSSDSYPGKSINTIMGDGILQSIEEVKKTDCEHFIVPIGNTNNNVAFRNDGTVHVQMGSSKQTFDITELQQMHRLCDMAKLIQKPR